MVASLLEKGEAVQLGLENEREAVESAGLEFLSFAIPDRGVPASKADAVKFVGDLTAALGAGKNVALHCRQGIGRSGMVAAAALMSAGIATDEAVDVVSRTRGVQVPETAGQMQWLEQLASEFSAIVS